MECLRERTMDSIWRGCGRCLQPIKIAVDGWECPEYRQTCEREER